MPNKRNKVFVLDTSVLLYSASSIRSFGSKQVVIPYVVLEELDIFKTREGIVGGNARQVARELNELRKEGVLDAGVRVTEKGGLIRVELNHQEQLSPLLDPTKNDDRILNVCLGLRGEGAEVVLVTKDINLAVRADVLGIKAQDFDTDRMVSSVDDMYTGSSILEVPDDLIDAFYTGESVFGADVGGSFHPNHYLTLVSSSDPGKTALARVPSETRPLVRLRKGEAWGVKSRNREQQFAMDALLNPEVSLVSLSGLAGAGKAQPLDAKVLTPTGYVTMGSICEGDLVSTPDGKAAKVIGVFPQGALNIYKVTFSDGTTTECCDDHLWETQTELDRAAGRRGKVKTLREIRETLNSKEHIGAPRSNHSVPMTLPVEFSCGKEVPMDAYSLGLLLGDGSFSHPTGLYFSTSDQELALALCSVHLDATVIKCKGKNYDYRVIRNSGKLNYNPVKRILEQLELFGCKSEGKFVPYVYKWSSVANRISLLQGLMDTDGTVGKDGTTVTMTTVSPRLAEDTKFLVESLGGKAVIKSRVTSYKHKGEKKEGKRSYRLFISMPPEIIPFRLSRKIDRFKPRSKHKPARYIRKVDFVGRKKAQCILVDSEDHLYLTNNFIVTHNTLCTLACALSLVQDDNTYDRLVVSRPVQPLGRDIGFLPGDVNEKMDPWMGPIKDALEFLTRGKGKGRGSMFEEMINLKMLEVEPLTYIRGRSLPNTLFILDEAQDISRPEVKTIVSRIGEDSKLVLIGDVMQISNPYLDSTNNGLSNVIEKFKPYDFAAHVTLVRGERSELATVASEIL